MSPAELAQWRKAQRAALLEKRQAVAKADHLRWSASITQWLVQGFPALNAMIVGMYWPFKSEFDPRFAAHEFRMRGAVTALPVVLQKGAPLEFREWRPGVAVSKGVFDLPVPEGTAVVQPHALLIPPVGFDTKGFRLGYGGGYFDRTLATLRPCPVKIGVAFELSRLATIHPQPHDIPMDFIVTEAGIYRVTPDGLQFTSDPADAGDALLRMCRERHLLPA